MGRWDMAADMAVRACTSQEEADKVRDKAARRVQGIAADKDTAALVSLGDAQGMAEALCRRCMVGAAFADALAAVRDIRRISLMAGRQT